MRYKIDNDRILADGTFMGQEMFGREELQKEGKEVVYQKWCGLFKEEHGVAVLNRGTYGGSAMDGSLQVSLLRTPVYADHPIDNRPFCDTDRNHDHIDIGEREFDYRLVGDVEHLDCQAEIYNQEPYALSFFPSGAGAKTEIEISLDNREVLLTSYKKNADGSVQARIYNASDKMQKVTLTLAERVIQKELGAFEFQTILL